jgi:hypothetical protein
MKVVWHLQSMISLSSQSLLCPTLVIHHMSTWAQEPARKCTKADYCRVQVPGRCHPSVRMNLETTLFYTALYLILLITRFGLTRKRRGWNQEQVIGSALLAGRRGYFLNYHLYFGNFRDCALSPLNSNESIRSYDGIDVGEVLLTSSPCSSRSRIIGMFAIEAATSKGKQTSRLLGGIWSLSGIAWTIDKNPIRVASSRSLRR